MGKKYFWLKLKDDFFNQKEIKMLRKLAGGDTFTVIYLKILLLSLKNDGLVYYDGIAGNMIEEISLEIDEEIENVQITFNYLQQKGLLFFNADDEVALSNIHSMIGSETAVASRVRKHREKKALQSNTEVTTEKHLGNTEIEKEIEKEIDMSSKPDSIPYSRIINHLNSKTGKSFKTTENWKKLIRARWNEGQREEDFKAVIDVKTKEWLENMEMNKYLRPSTLFGNKFDMYLQESKTFEPPKKKESDVGSAEWMAREAEMLGIDLEDSQ